MADLHPQVVFVRFQQLVFDNNGVLRECVIYHFSVGGKPVCVEVPYEVERGAFGSGWDLQLAAQRVIEADLRDHGAARDRYFLSESEIKALFRIPPSK